MFASSSILRPGTKLVTSASSDSISSPVMYRARCSACVPMSPMAPAPARAGSVRQSACLLPLCSSGVDSQPCEYSTTTLRTVPSDPFRTNSRACFTIGYAVYGCVSANTTSCFFTSRQSSSASSSFVVRGLSHTTWKPRSMNAFADGKCTWFGVTMMTKSMRSSSGRLASAFAISSKLP